eukprot:804772-Pleurochrysis_carterae.AAC.3
MKKPAFHCVSFACAGAHSRVAQSCAWHSVKIESIERSTMMSASTTATRSQSRNAHTLSLKKPAALAVSDHGVGVVDMARPSQ